MHPAAAVPAPWRERARAGKSIGEDTDPDQRRMIDGGKDLQVARSGTCSMSISNALERHAQLMRLAYAPCACELVMGVDGLSVVGTISP